LAVQGALHVQSSTGPTLLVLSQWMNALVSKFRSSVVQISSVWDCCVWKLAI